MVASGLSVRDDQLSEKSEPCASKVSDYPARIEDIFEWIDGIPLSKSTKNLARDFSDAVLMSEILKFYYPHLVCPHNYIPVNSVHMKRENWHTLNRKVLCKIGMRLGNDTIEQLVHSQPGAIEKLLAEFREKQMAANVKNYSGYPQAEEENQNEDAVESLSKVEPYKRSFIGNIGFFTSLFGFILTVLCFWRWFSKKTKGQSDQISDDLTAEVGDETFNSALESEGRLRESYSQLLQELRVKADVIKTLCHKVAFLEGTMKLKDMKIAALSNQLEQSSNCLLADGTVQTLSRSAHAPSLGSASVTKVRRRPRTQI